MSHFLPVAFRNRALTPPEINQLSPVALAYIGDAVFELYVRGHCLFPPKRPHDYHRHVVDCVRAEQQAHYLVEYLWPQLSEQELKIVKRGRNASPGPSRKMSAKIYQQATSFEALLGYLYLTNQTRLWELLDSLPIVFY
ncbi:MAG: ribonuclease III [Merismopedia sp. SIO2A8]|nr:ribonuclease III [Symploca sp. SIO2B6]NET52017.1 ribonuclease III [Merismopedia sp. SIO2A8]